jgi:hypothetical protein
MMLPANPDPRTTTSAAVLFEVAKGQFESVRIGVLAPPRNWCWRFWVEVRAELIGSHRRQTTETPRAGERSYRLGSSGLN